MKKKTPYHRRCEVCGGFFKGAKYSTKCYGWKESDIYIYENIHL